MLSISDVILWLTAIAMALSIAERITRLIKQITNRKEGESKAPDESTPN